MGYFKDKNTGEVVIIEEQAAIVRRIFDLYLSGYGIKAIAKILNAEGIKSQGYYQQKLLGKKLGYNKPEIAHRFLWENTGIKRVLQNEFYCGTLVCHRSYTSKINHIRKELPEEEHYRHENFVPAIVSREIWEQAQFLLRDNVERNVRAAPPLYGADQVRGLRLLLCLPKACLEGQCALRVHLQRLPPLRQRELYRTHRIDESTLDKLIYDELIAIKEEAETNYRTIETDVKSWLAKKNTSEKRIKNLTDRLAQRKSDQEQILLERIRDREHANIYTGMLEKCEAEIKSLTAEIEAIRDYDTTIRKRKAEMKSSIDILDGIIKDGAVSDNNLRLLVDNIVIHESDGKLSINIDLKAAFSSHLDLYDEDGALTAKAFAAN